MRQPTEDTGDRTRPAPPATETATGAAGAAGAAAKADPGASATELTAAQREVLAAQRADPANTTFNVGQYVDLRGPLDTGLLQEAVRRTLAEAPGLHLRLREEDGRLRQEPVPFDAPAWRLPRLDTSGAADPVAAAVGLVRDQLALPPRLDALFTDGGGPAGSAGTSLSGTVLVRVGPERHLLFQYFHHLAVDGYGVSLLTRRIAELYTALAHGTPPRPSPFAPVAVLLAAERAYEGSARQEADRAHWAARFADRPAPAGFTGRRAPASNRVLRETVTLDRAATALLETAARGARATWAEAVTAALVALLHRETGTGDAVLRMYATARTAPGTLRVPGMAVNVLPVRVPVGGASCFTDLLRLTAGEFRDVRAHQQYRGEDGERLPGLRPAGGPLLNLRPFDTELDFAGVPGHVLTLASGPVEDLSLSVVRPADGTLRLDLDANGALYDPGTLRDLAGRYERLLRLLAAAPDRALSALGPPS
ncbi:condensation domain-containing protein [Streptomyces sp. NPDC005805]|uniref:condensation domain-containing protein n=1 Tax=Streptomyces sp. NPDC005805 TaxID=3157068 RepID=UPI0033F6AF85